MGRLFKKTFVRHYNVPLAHSIGRLCMIFFHVHVHPALCVFPLVTVCTIFILSFVTINISESELIFKYHGQWKEGISLFVHTLDSFTINIMRIIRLVLIFPHFF